MRSWPLTTRRRLGAAVLTLAAACGGGGDGADAGRPDLDGGRFLVTALHAGGEQVALAPGSAIRIDFQDGELSADAGCNAMSGSFSVEGEVLRVSGLTTTDMFCDGIMEQEALVSDVLTGAPVVSASATGVVLTTGAGSIEMVDERGGG